MEQTVSVLVYLLLALIVGVGVSFWIDFRMIQLLHLRQQDLKVRVEQLEEKEVLACNGETV
jgi:hypothetical protein